MLLKLINVIVSNFVFNMLMKQLFIDNLQYSNWSLEVFEQMRG